MSYVFAIFTLWITLQLGENWLSLPRWVWWLSVCGAGVGMKLLLDGWSESWLGVGLGGMALFLGMTSDLILLSTDALKSAVLRNSRGR
jgi:hypothetical protein